MKSGVKGGLGAVERGFFRVFALRNGVGRGFLCLFLRIFAEMGGVFLRRSARFFIFLRRSFLMGVFFSV